MIDLYYWTTPNGHKIMHFVQRWRSLVLLQRRARKGFAG